ncbi:glycosyltransferase family 2 protein [Filomicrobium sp.]|uniref:glycosyltransferase family 2 protein n=1 Tax=Filomicrobium sp. TaxID=2024831 RepID=UPI0025890429|nr:glycosyltransferase family 2 protein [Filomicrobium sp.]
MTKEIDELPVRKPATSIATSGRRQSLSIVIPLLNEANGLPRLLARLLPVLERTTYDYEIVFIDDGSTDATLSQLRQFNETDPRLKSVSFSRNFGKEIAVAAGLRYARGDAVILMDADLQHPPETLPQFISLWERGYDDVYGQRMDRESDSATYRMLARSFYAIFKVLSGTQLHENAGDFRLLSRRAVDALNQLGERARFNKGLFAWIGFRSIGVPYNVAQRQVGDASRWSTRRLLRFAIDGIASFTTIPLRIWSYIGLLVSAFAFIYAAIFLLKTLIFGTDVAGFPTLIISILLLAGVQLISLGIIGEYLGRIYDEVKARPLFLVAEEIGFTPNQPAKPGEPHPDVTEGLEQRP